MREYEWRHINVTEVRISAQPGATIGDCMREAIWLACQEWINVTLVHNGREYLVLCNDLLGCVRPVEQPTEPTS
jgi:hypothetical protein